MKNFIKNSGSCYRSCSGVLEHHKKEIKMKLQWKRPVKGPDWLNTFINDKGKLTVFNSCNSDKKNINKKGAEN